MAVWSLVAGLLCGAWLGGPGHWSWQLSTAAGAVTVWLLWRRQGWLLAAIVAGLCWSALDWHHYLQARWPPQQDGAVVAVSGTIALWPEHLPGTPPVTRLVLEQARSSAWRGTRRLQLTSYQPLELVGGELLHGSVRLRSPRGRVNAGSRDSAQLDAARNIHARGTLLTVTAVEPGKHLAARAQLAAQLRQRSGISFGERILPALVVADRRALTEADWLLMQRTGTAHLLAISGLHVGWIAGAVWWLARRLASVRAGRGELAQHWAVWPAALAAWMYADLAGYAVPVTRAVLMGMALWGTQLLRLRASSWQVLGGAAALVLLWHPRAGLEYGFWLSFGAVALLLQSHALGVRRLVALQWQLSWGVGALAAWLFAEWGLVAPLANLVAVPVFTMLVVPLALLGSLVPGAESLLGAAAGVLDLLEWLLQGLDRANVLLPAPVRASQLLALIAAGLVLWAPPGPVARYWSLCLLLPWWWPALSRPAPGDFDLIVFDVGQGQAVAIRTASGAVLYDAGPGGPWGSLGAQVVAPWLRQQRLSLTAAWISHADLDHAGGWPALAPRLHGPLWGGNPEQLPGSRRCEAGQRWQQDGVRFEVFWPPPGWLPDSTNSASCVVRVRGRHGDAWLTGDIPKPVEYQLAALLASHTRSVFSVLLVPHHGSTTSSSYTLLRALAPQAAVVSAGHRNRYGHPAAKVQQRYHQLGIPLWNTADHGMIEFRLRGSHNPAPLLWRSLSAPPWRLPES
ncbi:DNA internalization-related competence protein ComEC/Rec2 [Isoalcanivorax beigongshangi]|uniref:DNA internalization-related competence protein ComEC/Rec2 n=1 Tax=Isoalcanivorax beigongshangi TaxID=3238810 RepID=A0ABV4AJG4_9GAMM